MHIDSATFIQFIRYALAGAFATLTHIIVFHLIAWKIFPALQARDHAVRFFKRFGILTTYAFSANIFTAVMLNYIVRKFFIFSG